MITELQASLDAAKAKYESLYLEVEGLIFDHYGYSLSEFIEALEKLPAKEIHKRIIPQKEGDEYLITKEVEDRLAEIAAYNAYKVEGEAGLLYAKLQSWYKKYGNFPTQEFLHRIIRFLKIDLLREETKVRYIDGEAKIGLGVGKSFCSLDAVTEEEKSLVDILSDANEILPNEKESCNHSLLLEVLNDREKAIIEESVFKENTLDEISLKFNLTPSRISQIRKEALEKMKSQYQKISEYKKPEVQIIIPTEYAEKLIKNTRFITKQPKKNIDKDVFRKSIYNHSNASIAKEVFDMMLKDDNLTLEQVCKQKNLSKNSLRQYLCKAGFSLGKLREDRKQRLMLKVWNEWLASNMNLNLFIKTYYNDKLWSCQVATWAKETGRENEFIKKKEELLGCCI